MDQTQVQRQNSDHDGEMSDICLAQRAVDGEAQARQQVSQLAEPIINYQTSRFCKRFCNDQRFYYRCTLPVPWGNPPEDALLCEWGNASYCWMLDDLTNGNRLRRFKGDQASGLKGYLFAIANSIAFYERWKDWRFGRRVYVPTYIQALDPDAVKVFFAMQAGNEIAFIAQKLAKPESTIKSIAHRILIELTKRNRLHLLDPPHIVSLTGLRSDSDDQENEYELQGDIPSHDTAPEENETREQLAHAWQQLSAVEQFVLEAMVIEQQDAVDVLAGLSRLNVSVVEGVAADKVDRQQLYYFRRKTIAKLAKLMGEP